MTLRQALEVIATVLLWIVASFIFWLTDAAGRKHKGH